MSTVDELRRLSEPALAPLPCIGAHTQMLLQRLAVLSAFKAPTDRTGSALPSVGSV